MPEEIRRRLPFVEKNISDITPEDVRVRLLGTVIDIQDNRMILDDGSGKITITFDQPPQVDLNRPLRVLGRTIPVEQGFEIQGELIQHSEGLHIDLYKKVQNLEKQINIL